MRPMGNAPLRRRRSFAILLSKYGLLAWAWTSTIVAHADVLLFSATDAGFVTEAGGSAKGDGTVASGATYNYSAGREVHYSSGFLFSMPTPMDRKNYFVFDLSTVPGPITAATLFLYAGPATGPPFPAGMHGYESPDPSETYGIAATSDSAGALADAAALKFANTVGSSEFDDAMDPAIGMAASLYTKLADGPIPLALTVISPATDGTTVALAFSPAGLTYLNGFVGSTLLLGGKVPTAMPPAVPQSVFGFTGPDIAGGDPLTPMLMITTAVPEARALWLVALAGVVALGVRLGQRR